MLPPMIHPTQASLEHFVALLRGISDAMFDTVLQKGLQKAGQMGVPIERVINLICCKAN